MTSNLDEWGLFKELETKGYFLRLEGGVGKDYSVLTSGDVDWVKVGFAASTEGYNLPSEDGLWDSQVISKELAEKWATFVDWFAQIKEKNFIKSPPKGYLYEVKKAESPFMERLSFGLFKGEETCLLKIWLYKEPQIIYFSSFQGEDGIEIKNIDDLYTYTEDFFKSKEYNYVMNDLSNT